MIFHKGYVYIVHSDNEGWYLVRQLSMKGWIAIEFAYLSKHIPIMFKSNGTQLWKDLNITTYRRYADNASGEAAFRKGIYMVSRHGKFTN